MSEPCAFKSEDALKRVNMSLYRSSHSAPNTCTPSERRATTRSAPKARTWFTNAASAGDSVARPRTREWQGRGFDPRRGNSSTRASDQSSSQLPVDDGARRALRNGGLGPHGDRARGRGTNPRRGRGVDARSDSALGDERQKEVVLLRLELAGAASAAARI